MRILFMSNQNDNQNTQSTNDQDILNQYASSIKTENDNDAVSGNLKEFNSIPIDTPTPISLDDSLNPSESLPEDLSDSKLIEENKLDSKDFTNPSIELNQELELESKLDEKIETDTNIETSQVSPESPQDIKQKIDEVLSYNTTNSVVNSNPDNPKTSNFLKVIFTFSLIIFIAIAVGLAYFIFNPVSKINLDFSKKPIETSTPSGIPAQTDVVCELNGFIYNLNQSFPSADGCNTCTCVSANNITCTEKNCSDVVTTPINTVTSATKSATTSTTNKTNFQKLFTDWNSYKEINNEERKLLGTSYWPSQVKSTDKLYSFTEKLLKGSVKMIEFDKNNLKTLIGSYKYIVYITPNYENWTNEYFSKTSDFNNFMTGIGDLSPIYAYPDKLVWSTTTNCGGVAFDPISQPIEFKEKEQCTALVKELETAFP